MIIDHRNCISDKLIGIVGCGEHKYYLDSLPSIDIVSVSQFTKDVDVRPEEVVRKSLSLAINMIQNDLMTYVNKDFSYSGVLDTTTIDQTGTYEWFGLQDIYVGFEVLKLVRSSNLLMKFESFEIISDRDIEGHEIFYVCDAETKSISVNLKRGRNRIEMPFFAKSDVLIYWNMSDFKIGKSDFVNYNNNLTYKKSCLPCSYGDCHSVKLLKGEPDSFEYFNFGIDLTASCQYDFCSVLRDNVDLLITALLYQTGIQYLIYALTTDRINAYTRNSKEKIQFLLLRWQGGRDEALGISYTGEYNKALKNAYMSLQRVLVQDELIFQTTKTRVINSLP